MIKLSAINYDYLLLYVLIVVKGVEMYSSNKFAKIIFLLMYFLLRTDRAYLRGGLRCVLPLVI